MPQLTSPNLRLELRELQAKLERDRVPHALATVVRVRGSASARPGSRMLISAEGKNLWGWVGGGCAESFTISQALEALGEGSTRVITADLDDEVFGLGMPCGGSMEIFVEPRLPPEELRFVRGSSGLRALAERFGFSVRIDRELDEQSFAECVRELAAAIARARGKVPSFTSPVGPAAPPSELLILGHSRITEELATLGALLGWSTRVYGLNAAPENYPKAVRVERALPDYEGLSVKKDSFVAVASHHKGDHHYIASALASGAAWVGMVASKKRAGLVLEHLRATGHSAAELTRVRSPAGVDLGARNPAEIALSIAAELVGA